MPPRTRCLPAKSSPRLARPAVHAPDPGRLAARTPRTTATVMAGRAGTSPCTRNAAATAAAAVRKPAMSRANGRREPPWPGAGRLLLSGTHLLCPKRPVKYEPGHRCQHARMDGSNEFETKRSLAIGHVRPIPGLLRGRGPHRGLRRDVRPRPTGQGLVRAGGGRAPEALAG